MKGCMECSRVHKSALETMVELEVGMSDRQPVTGKSNNCAFTSTRRNYLTSPLATPLPPQPTHTHTPQPQ